jgi:hypothetical protein
VVALGSGALVWALVWNWTTRQQGNRLNRSTIALPASTKAPPRSEVTLKEGAESDASAARTPALVAEILRRAPSDATPEERAIVWTFLKTPPGPTSEALWLLGIDEALTWIRGAVQASDEVESGLLELVQKREYPAGLREFALQHLAVWAEERLAGAPVLKALRDLVVSERSTKIAGQALQALCRSRFAEREMPWIRDAALALATDPEAHPSSRLAAIEVGGHCGFEEMEPCARKLLAGSQTVGERVVAFQVLGWVGSRGTLEWLEKQPLFAEGLAAAAHMQALQTLRERWIYRTGGN